MKLDVTSEEDVDFDDQLRLDLIAFAELLMDFFYLPRLFYTYLPLACPLTNPYFSLRLVKATGKNTAQPSPANLSAVRRVQGGGLVFTASPERLSYLRGSCLVRDHHRCVITRKFDVREIVKRTRQRPLDAKDDEGDSLDDQPISSLEVAHMLPHSLTQTGGDSELVNPYMNIYIYMSIFDFG